MKKIYRFLILTITLVLGHVGVATAITNGQPDEGRHPYVGLVVFEDESGPAWRCSGSLIAPNVVLTAGHCTDGAVKARVYFQEDVQALLCPLDTDGHLIPGDCYPFGGATSEGTAHTYDQFCTGLSCGNGLPGFAIGDVGIVVLTNPVEGIGFASLPQANEVGTLKNKTPLDAVGYGVKYKAQIPGNPYDRWRGPATRYLANAELVSGKFVHSDQFIKMSSNPSQGKGGTCFGDSGGPILLGGTGVVLAVASYVPNLNCAGVSYEFRVDTPEVLEWIYSFMPSE